MLCGVMVLEEKEDFTRFITNQELTSIIRKHGGSVCTGPIDAMTHVLMGNVDREDSRLWEDSRKKKDYESFKASRVRSKLPPIKEISFTSFLNLHSCVSIDKLYIKETLYIKKTHTIQQQPPTTPPPQNIAAFRCW